MQILNLSAEPEWRLRQWLPYNLYADKVVFLPDVCPGKSPLPTGTVVVTRQDDWRRFAVSDCGCGMRLLRSKLSSCNLTADMWNGIADKLRKNKGFLGDLGGGNHFLDALVPHTCDELYLLIHTGSRQESGIVDAYVDQPTTFDKEFFRVVSWAKENRAAIHSVAEAELGPLELILDISHNTFDFMPDGGVIIRKGAVHVNPGEISIIPSHMAGDIALVRATLRVEDSLNSLSHGTGRSMSRADCKPLAETFDFSDLRKRILVPTGVEDTSLRTEGPFAYRDLDACLVLLNGFVEVVERFSAVAYMGHL